MIIEKASGEIHLDENFVISPSLRLQEFRSSKQGVDAKIAVANGDHTTFRTVFCDGKKNFFMSIWFEKEKLRSASISVADIDEPSSWADWSEEKELARKAAHDQFLISTFGSPSKRLAWGKVESLYDPRSGGSSIVVTYS